MQTVTGDPATLVAAVLTQAEMSLRAGALASAKPGSPVRGNPREAVRATYEHYLHLVTTGEPPAAPD